MEIIRCTNPECKRKPILFEAAFVGVIKKICPKCKKKIEFKNLDVKKLDKICEL